MVAWGWTQENVGVLGGLWGLSKNESFLASHCAIFVDRFSTILIRITIPSSSILSISLSVVPLLLLDSGTRFRGMRDGVFALANSGSSATGMKP